MAVTATLKGSARYPGALTKSATDTLSSVAVASASTTLVCIANVPTTSESPTVITASDSGGRVYNQLATVRSAAGDVRTTVHGCYAASGSTVNVTITEPASGSTDGSGKVKWAVIEIDGSTSTPVAASATFDAFATSGGTDWSLTVNTTSGGANVPAPESSLRAVVALSSRVYGGTIAMPAPTGWTKIGDMLTQNGTESLHTAYFVKDSALAAGDTINQAFSLGSSNSPTSNTNCAGASAVLLLIRGSTIRARFPITDKSSGSEPVGATSTVGYVWKSEPSASAGTKYTGFTIHSDGSGGAYVDLDVTGKQGLVSGDTCYLLITDGVEAASPYNHGTSGGLLSGTVAEGTGDAPV